MYMYSIQVGTLSVLQASVGSFNSNVFLTKKLTLRAQQRSEQLRKTYTEVYDPEMLVFVDRHAALRCYMVTHYKGKENAMCMDSSVLG